MRTSELIDCLGRLERAAKRLHESWQETRVHWDDSVAEDFEQRHLEPILPQLKMTVTAIHQLADTFGQAHQACDDDSQLRD